MFYSNLYETLKMFKYFSHCGNDYNNFTSANKNYFCGVCNFLNELTKLQKMFNYLNEYDPNERKDIMDQLDKFINSLNDIKKHLNKQKKELISNLNYLRG